MAHPRVLKSIRNQVRKARVLSAMDFRLALRMGLITASRRTAIGFNDGIIYPTEGPGAIPAPVAGSRGRRVGVAWRAPPKGTLHALAVLVDFSDLPGARPAADFQRLLFDAANPDASVEKRDVTTVAPQALFLLNTEFMKTVSQKLADRLAKEAPDDESRIQRAYRLLFKRDPKPAELALAKDFLAKGGQSAWPDLAHVWLCSNEFAFVD